MARLLTNPRSALSLLICIVCFNFAAASFGWYEASYRGYGDQIMHLLGGAWIAVLALAYLTPRPHLFEAERSPLITFILFIGIVALVGISWELFEFALDAASISLVDLREPQLALGDTLGDLFADILGGAIVMALYLRSYRRRIGASFSGTSLRSDLVSATIPSNATTPLTLHDVHHQRRQET
jgi:hypothetical protein